MKVHDVKDEEGRVFAFEVSNTLLGRRGLCRVVRRIPGARLMKEPAAFSWFSEEEFCEFQVGDVTFVAWEPFGDNSRYWIGPKPPRWVPEMAGVREAFRRARVIFGFLIG